MGVAFLDGQKKSGGIKLNDVIEDYKYVAAGKEIKVGDFVSYINGIAGETELTSTNTQLSAVTNAGNSISAAQLDENRVFIAHSYGDSENLYGMVCTINGTTITYGTDTAIGSAYGSPVSAVALDENRVFIAHKGSNGTNLLAVVCTIDGTTITPGTDTTISSTDNTGAVISAVKLDSERVFIAHQYGNNYYLYGIVCTISGTKISKSTDTALVKSNAARYDISACLLDNGNVFVAYPYGTNNHLYGMVVTISGTTVTAGTGKVLVSSDKVRQMSAVKLDNGNVFIAHSYSTSTYHLYGIVCTISGTTITEGTDTAIVSYVYAGNTISALLLPNGNVFIAHRYGNGSDNSYLYGVICEISGTTITIGSDTTLNSSNAYTGYAISPVLLDNGELFIAHSNSSSYFLNAQIFGIDENNNIPTNNIVITEYEQQVTPAEETPFDAIALSDGLGGTETEHNEQVLIARPNVEVV